MLNKLTDQIIKESIDSSLPFIIPWFVGFQQLNYTKTRRFNAVFLPVGYIIMFAWLAILEGVATSYPQTEDIIDNGTVN